MDVVPTLGNYFPVVVTFNSLRFPLFFFFCTSVQIRVLLITVASVTCGRSLSSVPWCRPRFRICFPRLGGPQVRLDMPTRCRNPKWHAGVETFDDGGRRDGVDGAPVSLLLVCRRHESTHARTGAERVTCCTQTRFYKHLSRRG